METKTTHTAEQWRVDYNEDRTAKTFVYAAFSDGVGNRFYTQLYGAPEVSREELEANAHLIAAAPKLLVALEEAERVIRWAVQESHGRIKAEIVGGWKHHAEKLHALTARHAHKA